MWNLALSSCNVKLCDMSYWLMSCHSHVTWCVVLCHVIFSWYLLLTPYHCSRLFDVALCHVVAISYRCLSYHVTLCVNGILFHLELLHAMSCHNSWTIQEARKSHSHLSVSSKQSGIFFPFYIFCLIWQIQYFLLFLQQGAMSTLNKKFSEDLVITKKRLAETEALVNKEIAGIRVFHDHTKLDNLLVTN